MTAIADDYEYEERAAIRCFEAGFDEFEANQLALLDLKERRAPKQKQVEQKLPAELPADKKKAIEVLRDQAHELGEKMRKAKGEEKDSLFGKWMKLYDKIIELREQ